MEQSAEMLSQHPVAKGQLGRGAQDLTVDVESSEFEVVDLNARATGSWLGGGPFFFASVTFVVGTAVLLAADALYTHTTSSADRATRHTVAPAPSSAPLPSQAVPSQTVQVSPVPAAPEPLPQVESKEAKAAPRAHRRSHSKRERGHGEGRKSVRSAAKRGNQRGTSSSR